MGTSAWNALIHGYKRWAFLPKTCPKELLKCPKSIGGRQCDEAITWFEKILPRLKAQDKYPVIEAIQKPGEVMFVPGGKKLNFNLQKSFTQKYSFFYF